MKPIKQTVFTCVNGESEKCLCIDHSSGWMERIEGVIEQEGYFFTLEELNEYTANVIKQTLETAAEKAKTYPKEEYNEREGIYEYPLIISKKSITNTFEETFKKFEV